MVTYMYLFCYKEKTDKSSNLKILYNLKSGTRSSWKLCHSWKVFFSSVIKNKKQWRYYFSLRFHRDLFVLLKRKTDKSRTLKVLYNLKSVTSSLAGNYSQLTLSWKVFFSSVIKNKKPWGHYFSLSCTHLYASTASHSRANVNNCQI